MKQCVILSDSIHAQPHHPQLAQLQRVLFVPIGKGQLPMIIDRLGARHHDFDMFGILRRVKHPCEDSLLKSLLNTSDLYDFWCWSSAFSHSIHIVRTHLEEQLGQRQVFVSDTC